MRGTIDVELQSRLVGQIIMTDRAPELLQLRVRNPVWVHDTTRKNVEKTLLYCSSGSTFIFIHCESYVVVTVIVVLVVIVTLLVLVIAISIVMVIVIVIML